MIKNVFEEKTIRNANLPEAWQSQTALDELAEFLQINWEQRAVFYEDGKIESKIILTPTHYWAINKNASYEQKKTAKEFLLWLYTGDGRQYLNTLNFINPITTFEEIPELPPLLKDLKTYADTAKTTTLIR